ncbi:hypothetical protein KCU93_g364, partial [Aureobasidium melanogenum]
MCMGQKRGRLLSFVLFLPILLYIFSSYISGPPPPKALVASSYGDVATQAPSKRSLGFGYQQRWSARGLPWHKLRYRYLFLPTLHI